MLTNHHINRNTGSFQNWNKKHNPRTEVIEVREDKGFTRGWIVFGVLTTITTVVGFCVMTGIL